MAPPAIPSAFGPESWYRLLRAGTSPCPSWRVCDPVSSLSCQARASWSGAPWDALVRAVLHRQDRKALSSVRHAEAHELLVSHTCRVLHRRPSSASRVVLPCSRTRGLGGKPSLPSRCRSPRCAALAQGYRSTGVEGGGILCSTDHPRCSPPSVEYLPGPHVLSMRSVVHLHGRAGAYPYRWPSWVHMGLLTPKRCSRAPQGLDVVGVRRTSQAWESLACYLPLASYIPCLSLQRPSPASSLLLGWRLILRLRVELARLAVGASHRI